MIMKTATMFALAALSALLLGTGTAMAQEGHDDPGVPYWTLARQADALRQMEARNPGRLQAGSPDTGSTRPRISHVLPFNGDYTTLANPGGSQ
jgi:hypothetical protein